MKPPSSNSENPADDYFGRDLEVMSFAIKYHQWIANLCRPWVGKELVEVGAGSGNFSQILVEAFHPESLVTVEPSANMYPLLARHYENHPVVHPFQGCLKDWSDQKPAHPDSIFYVNVLEHIEDDVLELKQAHQVLDDAGHLFIYVPALPWLFGTADENFGHFRRYTKESLVKAANLAGFQTVDCRYMDVMGILPWWFSFVVLRTETLKPNMVQYYDKYVVPVMSRIEKHIPMPAGKNLLLVAKKRASKGS